MTGRPTRVTVGLGSGFHPLDHCLLCCRRYPGGRRRHLRLRWDFCWRDAIGAWLICVPLGRHRWVSWWRQAGDRWVPSGQTCARCWKEKP